MNIKSYIFIIYTFPWTLTPMYNNRYTHTHTTIEEHPFAKYLRLIVTEVGISIVDMVAKVYCDKALLYGSSSVSSRHCMWHMTPKWDYLVLAIWGSPVTFLLSITESDIPNVDIIDKDCGIIR